MKLTVNENVLTIKSGLTEKDFNTLSKFLSNGHKVCMLDEEGNEVYRLFVGHDHNHDIDQIVTTTGMIYDSVEEDGTLYRSIIFPGINKEQILVYLKEYKTAEFNALMKAEEYFKGKLEEAYKAQEALMEAFED